MTTTNLTLENVANLIKARELSPVELLQDHLNQIQSKDESLHSFITVQHEVALNAAKVAEQEIAEGQYRGPLHGIPISIKDNIDTKNCLTTCCSRLFQERVPNMDAAVVEHLKNNGAIIVGKNTLHEFSFGGPSPDLPWPLARNPWDTNRFTGGSSSGSAAAVAGKLVLGSIATDAAGSIRGPAGLCGVYGLKPTFGLVDTRGVYPLTYSLDHVGPIARTAKDLALLLEGMLKNPRNYFSALNGDVQGLRIGWLKHFYTKDLQASSATQNAIESAVNVFQNLGCEIVPIETFPIQEWHAVGMLIMLSEAFSVHEKNFQERYFDYGKVFRQRVAIGGLITAADFILASRRRYELLKHWQSITENVDVILTANTLNSAPLLDSVKTYSAIENPLITVLANLTGEPALAMPCGTDEMNLPLSMQLIGKRYQESRVLNLAYAYEMSV